MVITSQLGSAFMGQVSAVLLLPLLSFPDWTCMATAPSLHVCMRKRGLVREFADPLGLASVWPDRRKTLRDFQNKSEHGQYKPAGVAYLHTVLREFQAVSCCFTRTTLQLTCVEFLKQSRDGIKALEACCCVQKATRGVRRFCLTSRRVHIIWSICSEQRSTGVCLCVLLKRERILRHKRASVQELLWYIAEAFGLWWPLHLLNVCWVNTYCSDLISHPTTCFKSFPHKLIIIEAMDKHRLLTQFPTSPTKFI